MGNVMMLGSRGRGPERGRGRSWHPWSLTSWRNSTFSATAPSITVQLIHHLCRRHLHWVGIAGLGQDFFERVVAQGHEGIMAKCRRHLHWVGPVFEVHSTAGSSMAFDQESLIRSIAVAGPKKYMLFCGAGTSASSGIPTAEPNPQADMNPRRPIIRQAKRRTTGLKNK